MLLVLAAVSFSCHKETRIPATSHSEVTVTYVSNAGFLIAAHDTKIAVDCFISDLPDMIQDLMREALPPFDDLDLVLVTHEDMDHHSPMLLCEHLQSNPNAVFVSTRQVVSDLEADVKEVGIANERVRSFYPPEGESVRTTISGVELKILNLRHGQREQTQNLGYVFEVGGMRVFHMGDVDRVTLSELKAYQLLEEEIDIAFVPYWYLTLEENRRAVREGIRAKQIVPMHLDLIEPDEDLAEILRTIEADVPEASVFRERMQAEVF